MVAYLEKSIEHVDFDEIVDFLNDSPIRYALTVSPTIYVSYIEQLWSTTKIKIVNNERQICAKVNGKTIVISESSVRRDLQFNDEYVTPSHTKKVFANMRREGKGFSGSITPLFATKVIQPQADVGEGLGQPTEPQHIPTTALPSNVEPIPISSGPIPLIVDETVHEERGDSVERATTTAASLEAEQDSGSGPRRQYTILGDIPAQTRFERLSKQSNDPPLLRVNTLRSGEDRMKLNELMEICTKLSHRVLDLENAKDAQALEIKKLKQRVKQLEKKKKSRTPQLKRRLLKSRIESSAEKSLETQGRYGHDINVTTASAPVTTAGVSVSTDEPITPPTTTILIRDEDLIIAQTLMKMKSVKSKEKEVSSETTTRPTRGVTMQEPTKRLSKELQAELEEEERVARQREEEANLIS
ncbi:hypothetical protein Tco_1473007 [Tanacetum coccineum]